MLNNKLYPLFYLFKSMTRQNFIILSVFLFLINCSSTYEEGSYNSAIENCTPIITVDSSRGECSESLSYANEFSMTTVDDIRRITSNNIPSHEVGLFGNSNGSLNPNQILPQNSSYDIDLIPSMGSSNTSLFDNGPAYSFGILLNGIEVDPVAAEPWPHTKPVTSSHNWDWNLEATMVDIGLDCNNAHVQPTGKYHYHGVPTLYLNSLYASDTGMLLVGWAADGFPIYYKYGHTIAEDIESPIQSLSSSYQLKSGERPGDGDSAPCGDYTGAYTSDFEYVAGLGDLDECNGRQGVTPEFPNGTYYYVITSAYPGIPRCFVGAPSSDFKIGPG